MAARLRRIAVVWIVLAAAIYLLDLFQQTRVGLTNGGGRPLGDDFINYWSAGRLALEGRVGEIYPGAVFHAFQQGVVHGPIQAYHFNYPPVALSLLAPFAAIPYAPALFVWLGLSVVAFWLALKHAVGPGALLLALATPALFIDAVGGQNGAWTAALLGGGLCLLDRRPWLAGVLFGLLIYKPHLGPLIPVALVAGQRWKAVGSAAVVSVGLVALSLVLFGASSWTAYAHNLGMVRQLELEDADGLWHRMISVFVLARRLGAPVTAAYAVQAASGVFAAVTVAVLWFRKAEAARRNTAVIVGACLTTPYLMDYDLVMLAFAAAWIAAPALKAGARGTGRLAAAGLLLVAPLAAAPIGKLTGLAVGVLFLLPAMAVVLWGWGEKPAMALAAGEELAPQP